MSYLENIGKKSKKAFEDLKTIKHDKIKKVLESYNKSLLINKQKIIRENKSDIKNVKRNNLVDRLILNDKRIDGIRHSINEIANFKNPIGRVLESWKRPNKLNIKKVATPIGVIGVIYESRPNVTADVAALCLKSGNCSILRGGSEAINSNKILANLFREALQQNKINKNCVQFIENKDRKIVDNLLSKMSNYIDVIVPRGGKGLISKVQKFEVLVDYLLKSDPVNLNTSKLSFVPYLVSVVVSQQLSTKAAKTIWSRVMPLLSESTQTKNFRENLRTAGLSGSKADYVISVLPETQETKNLLSLNILRQFKPGSVFINVGRGSVINEEGLLQVFSEGILGGATLDVFQQEPLPNEHPFWTHPKIVITPHVSGWNVEDAIQTIPLNYYRLMKNEPLLFEIDQKRGY